MTATAMKRSGFSLQEIANVTEHKNLDSLKYYFATPTHKEKEWYTKALHSCGQKNVESPGPALQVKSSENYKPQEKMPRNDAVAPKAQELEIFEENVDPNKCLVPMYPDNSDSNASYEVTPKRSTNLQNVVNNQLRQASNLFQNATFNNCNFSFNLPN